MYSILAKKGQKGRIHACQTKTPFLGRFWLIPGLL